MIVQPWARLLSILLQYINGWRTPSAWRHLGLKTCEITSTMGSKNLIEGLDGLLLIVAGKNDQVLGDK